MKYQKVIFRVGPKLWKWSSDMGLHGRSLLFNINNPNLGSIFTGNSQIWLILDWTCRTHRRSWVLINSPESSDLGYGKEGSKFRFFLNGVSWSQSVSREDKLVSDVRTKRWDDYLSFHSDERVPNGLVYHTKGIQKGPEWSANPGPPTSGPELRP
jgi:hypothetical protein